MKAFKDGKMICLVQKDFINLQESPAIFVTPKEFREFLKEIAKPNEKSEIKHAQTGNLNQGGLKMERQK